ncbi:unnamed protein product [Ectocarpus sp. CCAP 1310/34]|nr:unnamed protein product [Ectocarpus sp. CCAP 1310/34]
MGRQPDIKKQRQQQSEIKVPNTAEQGCHEKKKHRNTAQRPKAIQRTYIKEHCIQQGGKQGATASAGYLVRHKCCLGRPTRFYSSARSPFLPPYRRFPGSLSLRS